MANADAKTDASLGAKGDAKAETGPVLEKLYVYVAQARFFSTGRQARSIFRAT